MKKTFSILALFSVCAGLSFAQITFDNLTINSDNTVLYKINHNFAGASSYDTLFSISLNGEKSIGPDNLPAILTCYPEDLKTFNGGNIMQVRNRYGTALYDFEKDSLSWIARSSILPEKAETLSPITTSPDGLWCVFVRKTSSTTGELIIQDIATQKYVILDKEAQFDYSCVNIKWSDDSKYFLYEKNNSVYFCNPDAMFKGLQIAEGLRRIGNGSINSVEWSTSNKIVFIDSDIVYLLDAKEFASFGMYSSFFPFGKILGRLNEKYDPQSMTFSINKDATELITVKSNNYVTYYGINGVSNDFLKIKNIFSCRTQTEGVYKVTVFWFNQKLPVIWTDRIDAVSKHSAFIFAAWNKDTSSNSAEVTNVTAAPVLSPDGKFFAYGCDGYTEILKINSQSGWELFAKIPEETVSLCYKNNTQLVIGGSETVKLYDIASGKVLLLFLSSAESATWDNLTGKVLAKNPGYKQDFLYNPQKNTWFVSEKTEPKPLCVQNEDFRIYKANAKNAKYSNGIYVRNLSGKTNTFALYKEVMQKSAPAKKISLAFDLLDCADGLDSIIALCKKYNVKPTYFVNGEFIRRYPAEVKRVAESGAEVGSLFYSCIDLTNNFYNITEDFVSRGLARNEDEYYQCTKKELALLWHAPFYKSNATIRDAGAKAGYSYIDFPLEVSALDSKGGKAIESRIIPITVGVKSESDKNVFYRKLELLINSLFEADYEIVPVGELN